MTRSEEEGKKKEVALWHLLSSLLLNGLCERLSVWFCVCVDLYRVIKAPLSLTAGVLTVYTQNRERMKIVK